MSKLYGTSHFPMHTAAVSLGSYNFSVLSLSLSSLLLGLLCSPYRNRLNGGCLLIPKEQFAA